MFSILPRYLSYSYVVPFLASSIFFVLFMLTFQMFKVVRLVGGKDVDPLAILELIGHIALTFIPMTIPIAVLFSTIFTLNKMSSDSEFVAMRSFGLSRLKLFAPFLVFAIMIGLLVFSLNAEIIPSSKKEFRRVVNILTSKGLISQIQKGNFFTEVPRAILFAENVSESGTVMEKVFINIRDSINRQEKTIFADIGQLIKEEGNKWGIGEVRLVLKNGSVVNTNRYANTIEKVLFETYNFPLTSGNINISVSSKGSMMSSRELWQEIKSTPQSKRKEKNHIKSEIEFWSRFNTPVLCIIFTLLGFTLGVQKTRGKGRNTASTSLLILIGYYALFFMGISMARSGTIPAVLAVFLPTGIGLLVGLYLFKKLEWVS